MGVALWLRLSKLPKNTLPSQNQVWLCGFDCRSCQKILCPPEIRCGFVASTVDVAEKNFDPAKSGVALWLRLSKLPKNTLPPLNQVWLCGFDSRGCRKKLRPPEIRCGFVASAVEVAEKYFALPKSGVALWLRQSRLPKKTSSPQNQVWLCGFDCRSCRKILCPPEIGCGFVASTVEVAEKYFAPPKSGVALWLRQSRLLKKTLTPRNQVWLCGFDSRGCRKKLQPPEIR